MQQPDTAGMSTIGNLIPKIYTVQEIFGFNSQIKIAGYEPGHPLVPIKTPGYVWDVKMVKDAIEWLTETNPDPLWLAGPTGCIAGDANLRYVVRKSGKLVNKKGGTMANLFKRWNLNVTGPFDFLIQSVDDDGVVFLNNITNVIDSGVKEVFLITTETGKQVKATADHKFLTDNGYRELREINVGDVVMTAARIAQKWKQGGRSYQYRKELFVKYHPSAKTKTVNSSLYYRVRDSRIAYEAHMNGITPAEYIATLNHANRETIDVMATLPPEINIHHRDENINNNAFTNLELLSHAEHALLHNNGGPKRYAEEERIVDIKHIGKEQVYDIAVTDPVRNFVVEDFVVHNCGKTDFLRNLFAGINMPSVFISAKSSTEPDDILGRIHLREGNTVFVPGDLLKAYHAGFAIVFDEIDGYPPEVVMACHRLLERAVVTLDDGSVITPAAKIFMAATANTRGDGQGGDIYAATNIFNLASLNRFEKWEMGYPSADVETKILENAFAGNLQPNIIAAIVKTATDIRVAYTQGNCPGPISIRDLLRWGRKLIQSWSRKDVKPIYHSFDKSFGNGVDPFVRSMLHTLIQTNFGVPAPSIDGIKP